MTLLSHDKDILWLVFDSLRYDVAQQLYKENKLPNLATVLPPSGWQHCHSPGSFTYPAHQAFFSGFLPTPIDHPKAPRLFAADFLGSETTHDETYTFHQSNLIESLKKSGYRTICIGGVGFFNKQTQLSQVLPNFFEESYWQPSFSVTDKNSSQHQFTLAASLINDIGMNQRFLMFINISAIHQPNYHYIEQQKHDDLQSHAAALIYVDQQLSILFKALKSRKIIGIFCSDHGTAYGEDGYWGHRHAHPSVMEVPYQHFEHEF